MLWPSSPADHDRAATQTVSSRTTSSSPRTDGKGSGAWLACGPGQEGDRPMFKQDKTSDSANSAVKRRTSFIPCPEYQMPWVFRTSEGELAQKKTHNGRG